MDADDDRRCIGTIRGVMTRYAMFSRTTALAHGEAMESALIPHYTIAEYLALERDADCRHEYLDGEIVAMVGASRAHNLLATRLSARLVTHLEGTPCRVYQSDMKVWIASARCFYYPDSMVCCGPVDEEPDDYHETRPALLVEIRSPGTAQRDDAEKRINYQSLPSLREYLLLDQDRPRAVLYRREGNGWRRIELEAGDGLVLESVAMTTVLAELYPGGDPAGL